jgi:MoaA/NifB/PqqE/SkfB family radical SAM enzyme
MAATRFALVTPGRPLVQRFTLLQNDLGVIRPRLVVPVTDAEIAIDLTLTRVFQRKTGAWASPDMVGSAAGTGVAQLRVMGAQLAAGETTDVLVPAGAVRRGDVLALEIVVHAGGSSPAVEIGLADDPARVPGHLDCAIGTEPQASGLEASLAFAPPVPSRPLPPGIAYSPVTQCNLNCPHCISADTRVRPNRLSPDVKAEIARWAADGQLLLLSSDYSGDLLWADHRFGGELDFVIGLGIPFRIDTNGIYLDGDRAERLARSRVANVNVSLDAACDLTFRRIRKGAPALAPVLENIRGLHGLRAQSGAGFSITLGFTLMRSNLDEWQDFIALGAALGVDAINTTHVHGYTAAAEQESLWHEPDRFNEARTAALRFAADHAMPMSAPPPFHAVIEQGHRFCRVPWESALILGNGEVRACCVPGTTMGNLHEETMAEIWQGARYEQLRATVNGPNAPAPCSICPMFRKIGNRASYLQYSGRQTSQAGGWSEASPFLPSAFEEAVR